MQYGGVFRFLFGVIGLDGMEHGMAKEFICFPRLMLRFFFFSFCPFSALLEVALSLPLVLLRPIVLLACTHPLSNY